MAEPDAQSLRHQGDDPARGYDAWAEYYDITDKDCTPYIEFYGSLISPNSRALLDLGCGTGSITVALAQDLFRRHADARIVGVDISKRMLAVARARSSRVEWLEGDIRTDLAVGTFDLVTCCFNTLQHLLEPRHLQQAFTSVRRRLSPDGIFAFDLYQPNWQYLAMPQTDRVSRTVVNRTGHVLERREDTKYDPVTKILTIDWRLQHQNDPSPIADTRLFMRQYEPPEIERALEEAGLTVRACYGGFDRTPLTARAIKQIYVCEPK